MKTEKYIFEDVKEGQFFDGSRYPETLEIGKVYVCKELSCSVHLCPCGCGDRVHLPFKEKNEPGNYWGLNANTFTPSIQKNLGCKSHYFIINGVVKWA